MFALPALEEYQINFGGEEYRILKYSYILGKIYIHCTPAVVTNREQRKKNKEEERERQRK